MSESQNLVQQIQEQTIKSAQDFYGESLGRINSHLQGNRSQMESLAEQIPNEEAQIQEMADSYTVIEELFDKTVQDLGVEDAVRARHCSRPSGRWLAKQRKLLVP